MQDAPNPEELLEAVIRFLRDKALPQLDPRTAFDARIACSLLQIVQRQGVQAAATDVAELERLRTLLDQDGDDLQALNRSLCERIADGRIDAANEALVQHLWAVTLAKLAVDQPDYSTYQRVCAFRRYQAEEN